MYTCCIGIIPRDKPQEIKTVRIVKRESERRQRDRDRSGNIGIPLTNTTSAKRVSIIEESVPVESLDVSRYDLLRLYIIFIPGFM